MEIKLGDIYLKLLYKYKGEKKNIVSVSFFKMKDGSYKNFNKYTNGIIYLHDHILRNFKDFKLRIYIDNSIYKDKKLYNLIKSLKLSEIVLFNVPRYKDGKDHHLSTFGTLMRFIPFFNFPENDSNIVIISDIDINDKNIYSFIRSSSNISLFKKDTSFIFQGDIKHTSNRYKSFIYKEFYKPYILSGSVINKEKIDISVLYKFLDNRNIKKSVYPYSPKKCKRNICFGYDEYFLNSILIKYCFDNDIKIIITADFYLFNIVNYFYLKGIDKSLKEKAKEIYKKLSEKLKLKGDNYFQNIDNIIYKNGSLNLEDKMSDKIVYEMYKIIKESYENKDFEIHNEGFCDIVLNKKLIDYIKFNYICYHGYEKPLFLFENKIKNNLTNSQKKKLVIDGKIKI